MTIELPEQNQLFLILGELKGKLDIMLGNQEQMQATCLARRPLCEARMAAIETFQAVRKHELTEEEQADSLHKKVSPHWWIAAATWVAILIGDGVMLWVIMHMQVVR